PQHAETQMERVRRALPRRRVYAIATSVIAVAATIVAIVALLRPAGESTTAYTVVGTTSAPGVQGTLTYDSSAQQAVMTVTGLPALTATADTPPRVYEVWLVGGNGASGVAFLTESPLNHSWSTVIHTDLSQYTAVAATAEPYGGSLQPTSPQLLSVQLTR
ncbi:MAG: anti-sigma factor, partial [Candidatus Dormibacteraeota bacterium]|nr:anti-sigma factor [Candidatus Dormibacteraeota bacterium]